MYECFPYPLLPSWLGLWWVHRPNIPKIPRKKESIVFEMRCLCASSPFRSVRKLFLRVSNVSCIGTGTIEDSLRLQLTLPSPVLSQNLLLHRHLSQKSRTHPSGAFFTSSLSLTFCDKVRVADWRTLSVHFSWLTLPYSQATFVSPLDC